MEIIPSIYILDGKVVSLYKGKIEQKETYYKSPKEMTENFAKEGAKEIFLLDVNGASDGSLHNEELILEIIKDLPEVKFYLGGGISNESLI